MRDRVDPELGTVRRCRDCCEEWPLDEEFFYPTRNGKMMTVCRACWADRCRVYYRTRRAA